MSIESISGRIRRIKYHRVGPGSRSGVPFLIAEIEGGRTVKGEMRDPSYTELYRFFGEWRPQKSYGDAFEFMCFEEVVEDSIPGVEQYLQKKVRGLGPKKAAAIIEAFGVDTLRTLQADPNAAINVAGITHKDVEEIEKFFSENRRIDPVAVAKLIDMFQGHSFPRKLAENIVLDFGSDAPSLVRVNPYLLLAYPRTGWKGVDPFALAQGYDSAGTERHVAAIVESLERHTNEGHTYASRNEIDTIAYGLLKGPPSHGAWWTAINSGRVVTHELLTGESLDDGVDETTASLLGGPASTYALPRIAKAESAVAHKLVQLAGSSRPLPFEPDVDGLNDDQRSAVEMMARHGVCLLLGAPGTGKTYTVGRFVAECLNHEYGRIRCVAPTGKAAKRAEESIAAVLGGDHGIPSTTVHRALEPTPGEEPLGVPEDSSKIGRGREGFRFARNESNPVECDLLIVDETSMLDARLLDSLLEAVTMGTRIVFVGDVNQLPSVGPGAVLRDLKESGVVPYVELNKIVRSDGGGRVVRACHAIKDGQVPQPAEDINLPLDNWVHVEATDPASVESTIVDLYRSIRDNGNYDPYWDVQVVSAEKTKAHIGCRSLNERLSDLLNPRPADAPHEGAFRPEFRSGDKVVRTKNGVVDLMAPFNPDRDDRPEWTWEGQPYCLVATEVVNGDTGRVEVIVEDRKHLYVVVRFRNPDRLCRLPMGEAHLEAAFAMTVHKSQGSGFKVVIVPVHALFYWSPRTNTGLFSRELFYTAISRAETLLITVGQWPIVEAVVGRQTVGYRRTLLAARLKEASDKPAVYATEGEPG